MFANHALESEVRGFCRSFPAVFKRAQGIRIYDVDDNPYLDFVSGCGALNYGHNHSILKQSLLDHVGRDGLSMSLDLMTEEKHRFLDTFSSKILDHRGLDYKVQFPGPTGTNAVEAAIKISRKFTGRSDIFCLENAFHGCTLGSLMLTHNEFYRRASLKMLPNVIRLKNVDCDQFRDLDVLNCSGAGAPAAIIVETTQGEGGLNSCTGQWLQAASGFAKEIGALFIIDDIQAGCGRTGSFFSFEKLGVEPDIVILAKSLSGFGLPMSIVLLKPEVDIWEPSEHNGTFRGNVHAFVTANAAINEFWSDRRFSHGVCKLSELLQERVSRFCNKHPCLAHRGRGLMQGIVFQNGEMAAKVSQKCWENGILIDVCGPDGAVLKFMPPLIIPPEELEDALDKIFLSIESCLYANPYSMQKLTRQFNETV